MERKEKGRQRDFRSNVEIIGIRPREAMIRVAAAAEVQGFRNQILDYF